MPDSRLIDANALMKNIGKIPQLRGITYGRMKKAVEETPTIDAVPVVRCRECVHNEDEGVCPHVRVDRGKNWLEIIKPHADGFCYLGERMDGGAEG